MQNYEIIVKIESKKNKKSSTSTAIREKDGSVRIIISEEEAIKIDEYEKALLETSYAAMREAIGDHFTEVSKEKALENGVIEDLWFNTREYKVDGEVGRFEFETHAIEEEKKCVYNTAEDFFVPLKAKEWYKTTGYKDLAYVHGTTQKSYRKSSDTLNRIRHQKDGGTPMMTVKDNTEAEGTKVLKAIENKSQRILEKHNFTQEGKFKGDETKYQKVESVTLAEDKIEKAIEWCEKEVGLDCNLKNNPMIYENPEHTVNVSIDDVKVKKQKSKRKKTEGKEPEKLAEEKNTAEKSKRRPAVYNTIIHVEKGEQSYILNGHGIKHVLTLLIAFLINGDLLRYRLQFFADGYTSLHHSILHVFSWFKNISILLDWYHLEKKCKEELSRAMKGRMYRNKVLDKLTFVLWYGLVDEAIEILKTINPDWIKNPDVIAKLVKSLQRNRPYIPCYAVRKKLGLRNSSNIGEKMNDLVVSERQKHNGMSWSKPGSVALASLTTLIRNNEHEMWFEKDDVEFRLAG